MNKIILTIILSSLLFACSSVKLTEEQLYAEWNKARCPFSIRLS